MSQWNSENHSESSKHSAHPSHRSGTAAMPEPVTRRRNFARAGPGLRVSDSDIRIMITPVRVWHWQAASEPYTRRISMIRATGAHNARASASALAVPA